MNEKINYPGTGQVLLGSLLVLAATGCAVFLLFVMKELAMGGFDRLPFLQNFLAIVTKSDAVTVKVGGAEQQILIPKSIFFISAISMYVFTLSIVARLLRGFLQGGIELIHGGSRKKLEKMIVDMRGGYGAQK